MKERICCIFNLPSHYRAPIYKLMDKELKCDFYFGDKVGTPIELMDYQKLNGFKKILPNKKFPFKGFIYQKGAWKLIFHPYKHYIVTGSSTSLSNWFLILMAIPLGKKVYSWGHGMKAENTPAGTFISKHFHRLCYKIFLYGEFSRKLMIKYGIKENKMILIYNSLDYNKQISIRKNLKVSTIYTDYFRNTNPVIFYIGRIQKSKRLDLLVKALKQLEDRKLEANLVLIGPEIDDDTIPKLVHELNLQEKVWFYGPCYDEQEIGQLIFDADLCVSPGPIGLTALHAMTYGAPIITNDNFNKQMPEFEVIKANVTGEFYKEGDLKDLTTKIANWINLNPEKREQIRIEAYKVIDEKYNPNNQIKIFRNSLV